MLRRGNTGATPLKKMSLRAVGAPSSSRVLSGCCHSRLLPKRSGHVGSKVGACCLSARSAATGSRRQLPFRAIMETVFSTEHSSPIHQARPTMGWSNRVILEATMLRNIMIALTVLVAVAALSDNANARARHWHGGHWHGHHHHGHWHGGGWGWPAAAVGFGLGTAVAYGAWGYPYYYGGYYGGCYRTVRVARPNGWRWRRVWVCG